MTTTTDPNLLADLRQEANIMATHRVREFHFWRRIVIGTRTGTLNIEDARDLHWAAYGTRPSRSTIYRKIESWAKKI